MKELDIIHIDADEIRKINRAARRKALQERKGDFKTGTITFKNKVKYNRKKKHKNENFCDR